MSQTHMEPKSGSPISTPPGLPRWVKVSGIIGIVIILLFAIMHLSGAHGPASHMPTGNQSEPTMTMAEGGHKP